MTALYAPELRGLLRRTSGLVVGLALLLQGCAGLIQGRQEATRPVGIPGGEGRFLVQKGRPGIVIGAPQDDLDTSIGVIAGDLARLTGWSLVVAQGASLPGRPAMGIGSDRVVATPVRLDPETWRVDDAYRRHVAEAAQGPLGLYVEVYGNARRDSGGRVEIVTRGLSPDDAWRLRTLFELIRDSRLDDPAAPRLEARVTAVDPARPGALAVAPRALHVELPAEARTTYREVYTRVLGAFLSESVPFLMPRAR